MHPAEGISGTLPADLPNEGVSESPSAVSRTRPPTSSADTQQKKAKNPDKDTASDLQTNIFKSLKSIQERRQSRDMEAVFGEQVAGILRRIAEPRQREMVKIRILSMLFDAEFPDSSN